MNAQAHTSTPTNVNPGILAMRQRLLEKRANPAAFVPKTATKPKPAAPKTPPSERSQTPPDEGEQREFRVCVLVAAGENATTHVWVTVQAGGPQRAGRQARAQALQSGHTPVGVCATLRDDAPQALLAAAK